MIRIYGGVVTDGLTDGVEIGTAENPIVFNGMYPAPNGEAIKALTFAVRTDGELIDDVAILVAMLDSQGKDLDSSSEMMVFSYYQITGLYSHSMAKRGSILAINSQTLLFKQLNATNQLFTVKVKAKGTESASTMPDLRGKLYIIPSINVLKKIS